MAAGHALTSILQTQELTPGGPQKVWVQSQTTFATLHKNEDGEWEVQPCQLRSLPLAGTSSTPLASMGPHEPDPRAPLTNREVQRR